MMIQKILRQRASAKVIREGNAILFADGL